MTSDPKPDVRDRTTSDPDGRDHDDGLAAEKTRGDVDRDERFANSREGGVVDEHSYLDDVGDAVASTIGSAIGMGEETDEKVDDDLHGRDPKTPDGDEKRS